MADLVVGRVMQAAETFAVIFGGMAIAWIAWETAKIVWNLLWSIFREWLPVVIAGAFIFVMALRFGLFW